MGAKLTYPQDDIPVDRTFIVTGGNTGIGYQTAKCIAKQGGRVIIACRSEERAKEAIEKMQKEHEEEVSKETKGREKVPKNAPETSSTKDAAAIPPADEEDDKSTDPETKEDEPAQTKDEPPHSKDSAADQQDSPPPLKVEFMALDLASLSSTMEFVNAYKAKGYPLHVLICNAGLGLTPFEKTDDGFELQFQVNYLSHFLMTLHFLPLLRESAPNSRIINVSSVLHSAGTLDLKNIHGEVSYDRIKNYGNSKLFQVMNMFALSHRLKDSGISVFSLHPGYVDSGFIRGSSDLTLHRFADSVTKGLRMKRNTEEGAMTSLVAALDTSYDGKTALYFKDCKPASPCALSKNAVKQEILWKYSLDCIKDHITDDLLKDLQLPETPETKEEEIADEDDTKGENKPEEEGTKEQTESKPDEGDKSTVEEASKSVEETEPKPEEATQPKPEKETEQTSETETESKPEEVTKSKPEEVTESKPEEVTESKPEEVTESKPQEVTESKPEEESGNKPTEEVESEEQVKSTEEENAAESKDDE